MAFTMVTLHQCAGKARRVVDMFPWMKMFINIIPMDPPHCTPLHLTLGASEIVVKVVENGKIGRTARLLLLQNIIFVPVLLSRKA